MTRNYAHSVVGDHCHYPACAILQALGTHADFSDATKTMTAAKRDGGPAIDHSNVDRSLDSGRRCLQALVGRQANCPQGNCILPWPDCCEPSTGPGARREQIMLAGTQCLRVPRCRSSRSARTTRYTSASSRGARVQSTIHAVAEESDQRRDAGPREQGGSEDGGELQCCAL